MYILHNLYTRINDFLIAIYEYNICALGSRPAHSVFTTGFNDSAKRNLWRLNEYNMGILFNIVTTKNIYKRRNMQYTAILV